MFLSALIKKPSICSFDSKEKFATNLELALERNQIRISQQCKAPPERQRWMCQPPDFSYKVYSSSRKPVGNYQELKKKEKKKTFFEELHKIRSGLIIPVTEEAKQTKIATRFPYTGSNEAKLMSVKMGKFTSNIYEDPKPYDYRQYEQGIPDFVTSYARDPLNLKFKSQCLSKIYGLPPLKDEKKKFSSKENFITHKPQELKWDSKLFLPKEPWPTKACSFTVGQCERSMPKDISPSLYVKPEPLGFLLPTGIAQTVQELKYE
ncbi:hypothetical protein L345_02089, partial [Ophiophagus hannah]